MPTMKVEITLQSTDSARPNNKLWEQIESRHGELLEEMRKEEPAVQSAEVTPKAGFPTGVETFVIVVAIAFATGVAELAKQAGKGSESRLGSKLERRSAPKFARGSRRTSPIPTSPTCPRSERYPHWKI